jgi:hypothetical protein
MICIRQALILGFMCLTPLTTAVGQSPQLVVQTGHGQAIYALAISPDKKLLASGGADKKIIIWDVPTGRQMYTLTEHTQTVLSLARDHGGDARGNESPGHPDHALPFIVPFRARLARGKNHQSRTLQFHLV